MDNFMDKLAERYNAQEMIRANSQAESAQLTSLQEQVEAYETVLQEMRKLNYKNTELTEKMYALVDESIEKVRSLQSEAGAGMDTEQVSREMTDAVNTAVSEAVRSLDENVARSLAQTLENALRQPTEDIRLSTDGIREQTSGLMESIEEIRNETSGLKESLEGIRSETSGLKESLEEIKNRAAAAPAEDIERAAEPVISEVTVDTSELKESLDAIQDKLFGMQQTETGNEEMLSAVARALAEIKDRLESAEESSGASDESESRISELISELKQQSTIDGLTQETLSALAQSNAQTLDSLTELKASVNDMKERSDSGESSEAILSKLSYITDSMESTKNAIADIRTMQSQAPAAAAPDDQIVQVLGEIMNKSTEIHTNVRSLKGTSDENKKNIQSALDSAVYGIKQDNREIIEFMQRLNAALTKLNSANADKDEEKAAEEAQKAEEERQKLEERFRQTEDFMHKESVKVYRNVQAVINEKSDMQKQSSEEDKRSLSGGIGGVKAMVLINMILTVVNLALIVLRIFEII